MVGVGVRVWLALTVATVFAATATGDEFLYGGPDWYMSAAPMLAISVGDLDSGKLSGGATLSVGFRFNRWLSSEITGEWAEGFEYQRGSEPSCTGARASNGYNAWQVTAGGRLYATTSRLQPFLLTGGGIIQTRDHGGGRSCTSTGFVGRFGAGVDLFVTKSLAIALTGTYVLPVTGGTQDHDYVSMNVGLTWY